ncbi:MAG TPA: sugar transferase [Actinomycetes bacterium]
MAARSGFQGRPAGPGAAWHAGSARAEAAAKRALDLVIAAVLLLLLAPLLLAVALLVRLTSPGPALFKQTRLGHCERPFTIFKFRTMWVGGDDSAHRRYVAQLLNETSPPFGGRPGLYKLVGDPRVTPLGALLRRTSVDELPQLFNVLRGEMSLVGPRPAQPWEVELFRPQYRARFLVKPGITGLWQVSGRNHVTMRQALELDVRYVETRNLGLDLGIIWRTIPAVLRRTGAA